MDSGHSGWTRRGVLVAGLSAISSVATVAGGADTERSSLHSTTADGSAVELTSSSSSFQYNPRNTGYTDSPGLSRQRSQQLEISTDDPPPTVRSPAVVDGVAYTADSYGGVRTYDFEAGESGWQTTGKSSWSGRNSRRFVHTLVVHNEAIYHATPTNIVAHGTDGRFRWTASADWDTPRGGAAPLTTAPIAAGGLILGCLHDGVYAIDPQTGSRAWKLPMEYQHTGTPAASNGIAYFTRSEGYVHAVDAAAGEVVWKTYLGPASAPLFNNYTSMRVSAPTVFGDAVYVTGSVP